MKKYLKILILTIFIPLFSFSSAFAATSGHLDLSSAYNNYYYLFTQSGNPAIPWASNNFGVPIYSGTAPINGITWTVSLSSIPYGQYSSSSYQFTLRGNGDWGYPDAEVRDELLANFTCEVWDSSNVQVPSTTRVLKNYYYVGNGEYAVDYRCSYQAVNQTPHHIYARLGNNSSSQDLFPIIQGYSQTGNVVRPFIRNVSIDWSSSNESQDQALLGDLVNGQKNIYDNISNVNNTLNQTNNLLEQQQEQDQQDRDNLETQQSDTEDTAEDVGADITTGFQSLFSIITSYIGVINSPPSSDCKIDGDMGHMDLGSIDICKLSLPQGFGVIASLLLIGAVIPFAFITIKSLIDLITEGIR